MTLGLRASVVRSEYLGSLRVVYVKVPSLDSREIEVVPQGGTNAAGCEPGQTVHVRFDLRNARILPQ